MFRDVQGPLSTKLGTASRLYGLTRSISGESPVPLRRMFFLKQCFQAPDGRLNGASQFWSTSESQGMLIADLHKYHILFARSILEKTDIKRQDGDQVLPAAAAWSGQLQTIRSASKIEPPDCLSTSSTAIIPTARTGAAASGRSAGVKTSRRNRARPRIDVLPILAGVHPAAITDVQIEAVVETHVAKRRSFGRFTQLPLRLARYRHASSSAT